MTPRDILNSPDKWCKRHYALDKEGHDVMPEHPDMVKTCLLGSCRASTCNGHFYHLSERIGMAINKLFPNSRYTVTEFNDQATWEQVNAVLDEAFPKEELT